MHVIKQNPEGETEEKGRDSYEKMDENDSHNDGCSDGIDSLPPTTLQDGASLRAKVKLPDNVLLEE